MPVTGTEEQPTSLGLSQDPDLDDNVLAELPTGSSVLSVSPSGASQWVQTVRIVCQLENGEAKSFFKKSQSGDTGRRMMEGTYASEEMFHKYIPNNVPKPLAWGHHKSDKSTWFYLCEFRDMMEDEVPEVDGFVNIISQVHKETMGQSKQFGFHLPTHLANIPNDNSWQDSWELWFTQAMQKMLQVEEDSHGKDEELEILKDGLFKKVIPRLLRPLETGGRSIKPCLVHSDLWPGNAMPDADTDEIVIFDSCAFWGHNEADLGSWRAPRYRMGRPFLKQYQRVMGMSEPRDDWDDRNALYAIRYDLLHSALFPNSTHGRDHRSLAMAEMRRLIEKHPQGLAGFDESS